MVIEHNQRFYIYAKMFLIFSLTLELEMKTHVYLYIEALMIQYFKNIYYYR